MNEPIAVTAEQAAPRCVVLLKSVQIAHQAGMYLLNGRWHKHTQDKPAPKGVPVVAAKPASGHTRMTGEMWEKVYAHADNSNKATYVKKLDKLKDAYYAGDAHAILAGSYPNDTTNKKVVLVANYLLGLMGSEHTVTPGLKLGTHPALSGAAPATPSAPAPVTETPPPVQEAPAVVPDPEPVVAVPAAPENGPGVLETAPAGLPMPDFVEGKTTQGVVDYYQAVAKEIQALHAAGDAAGLEKLKADGLVPSDKGKVGNTWKGKTENSKMILAMQAEALQQLGAGAVPPPTPEPAAPPAGQPEQPVTGNIGMFTGKTGMLLAVDLAGSASAAADAGFKYLKDNGTTEETVGHVVQALQGKGYSDMADKFQAALDTANKIKADAAAAKEAPAPDEGPKEGDTKQGADGMLVLKDGHWVKADQGEPEPDAPGHPVDLVPMPDLSDLNNPTKAKSALEALKDQVKEQGLPALKGLTKKMKSSGKLITTLPGGSGYKIIGYEHLSHKSHAQIFHYVEALKAAAGGKPPAKAKAAEPAAPASPAAAPAPEFPSMDSWQQIGPQAGSNAGGKFVDPDGAVWYCKFPKDENIAKSEVLAAKLYAAAGIAGQDAQLVTKDGKVGIASKWVDVSKASPAALAKAKGTKAGFAVDAWLANHDVIGLEFDNLQIDANGNAVRVDAGGSLEYRAQGAKKEFGNSVTEIETLRDKAINDKSAAVFGKMTKADITASVANVLKVSSAQIYALVNTYGPGTPEEKAKLAATLVARKADLLAKYPKAKKEKKIVFKPEDISAPPSFINWGGQGTSGPSSKEFINQANEKAVQSIYTAAQTGGN